MFIQGVSVYHRNERITTKTNFYLYQGTTDFGRKMIVNGIDTTDNITRRANRGITTKDCIPTTDRTISMANHIVIATESASITTNDNRTSTKQLVPTVITV